MKTGTGLFWFGLFLWMASDEFIPETKGKYWQANPIEISVARILEDIFLEGEIK